MSQLRLITNPAHAEAHAWTEELVAALDERDREYDERIEQLARATIALRVLSAARDLDTRARAHAERVLEEAAKVREELARAELAWQQAEAIARGLLG